MSHPTHLTIGLFGFGVVGEGIYHVLNQSKSLSTTIQKICIKHPNKKRNAPLELFTTDQNVLLHHPDINVIVELIDDADEAYIIVKEALKQKKHVVSANKKLIALHFDELIFLSRENGVSFLYEAAVCGSIPIIRNLEEYYDNDWLHGITGIVNGSTNYILTQMRSNGLNFSDALKEAQVKGFAESNPILDIHGYDAVNKLSILLAHIYGTHWKPEKIMVKGIQAIHASDFLFAKEKGFDIKLIAQSVIVKNKICAFVLPTFIQNDSPLFHLDNEYNGVLLKSKLSDEQFLYGKGAGRFPTSSAVLSDLSALRYGYKYEYRKAQLHNEYELSKDFIVKIYVSYPANLQFSAEYFENIEIFFKSPDRNYVIGTIYLQNLIESKLIFNDSYSVIFCNEILLNGDKEMIQECLYELA